MQKNELINIKAGEVFLVRDLFKGYEWNRIYLSDRLIIGTLFLNYIKTDNMSTVPIEKTSSGQQRYKKTALLNKVIGQEEHNEIV